jgi:hypothetical protein
MAADQSQFEVDMLNTVRSKLIDEKQGLMQELHIVILSH